MRVVCSGPGRGKGRNVAVRSVSCRVSCQLSDCPVHGGGQSDDTSNNTSLQCLSPSILPIRTISIYQLTTVYNCLLRSHQITPPTRWPSWGIRPCTPLA